MGIPRKEFLEGSGLYSRMLAKVKYCVNGKMPFGYSNKKIVSGLSESSLTEMAKAETRLKRLIFFLKLSNRNA